MELDSLALELDCADLEIDANGGDVALGVRVVGKAQQKARLAHTWGGPVSAWTENGAPKGAADAPESPISSSLNR